MVIEVTHTRRSKDSSSISLFLLQSNTTAKRQTEVSLNFMIENELMEIVVSSPQ